MKLQVEWSRPVRLKDVRDDSELNMVYSADLNKFGRVPGVYIFGRIFGQQFEALYVGKANKIRGRIRTQLNNSRLMQHLLHAKLGKRIVLAGTLVTRPGQQLGKCLALAERALIRHFLSEGHDLVNVSGVKLRRHELASSGRYPKRFFPKIMYLEKTKGE
jgi:hypothetical protein